MLSVEAALAALVLLALVLLALAPAAREPRASPGPPRPSRSISVRPMRKYIVNLDTRADRMAVTVPKLHRFGFRDVERWPAVDARRMSRAEVDRVVRPDARAPIWSGVRAEHSELSLGAVGCFLSHLQIWASLAESPDEAALVFEDDTDPTITSEQVDAALMALPDDWDIVFLGVFGEPYDPARLSIRRVEWFFGTHAYVVRRRCAQKLLARALPMHVQLDSWLSRLSMGGLVRLYAIANSGWAQNAQVSETDIQTPVLPASQN
jgi:GR25 family glycosyltransferase involved in LPS biosynthesis